MDEYALQPALLHRRGRAAHKGRFAAAGAALENDQVVELCIKELFIQPVKTLRAVRAEEEMCMLHGPPPMVLVPTSTYARRRIHVCAAVKLLDANKKSARLGRFSHAFSDAEQLALLRRKLLLGDDAGVEQRLILLELLNGVRRSAGLRGGSRLRGTRSGLRRAGGNELHQVRGLFHTTFPIVVGNTAPQAVFGHWLVCVGWKQRLMRLSLTICQILL